MSERADLYTIVEWAVNLEGEDASHAVVFNIYHLAEALEEARSEGPGFQSLRLQTLTIHLPAATECGPFKTTSKGWALTENEGFLQKRFALRISDLKGVAIDKGAGRVLVTFQEKNAVKANLGGVKDYRFDFNSEYGARSTTLTINLPTVSRWLSWPVRISSMIRFQGPRLYSISHDSECTYGMTGWRPPDEVKGQVKCSVAGEQGGEVMRGSVIHFRRKPLFDLTWLLSRLWPGFGDSL